MDRQTKRHHVVGELLNELFEGDLQSGDRLRVEHLADRLGVSVTPVREALVELAGLGMVELQPNRGAVVQAFGPRQVRELCDLRRILECEATRGACERLAPFELASLEDELSALIDAKRTAKWSAQTRRLDTELHDLIAQRCGNERLTYEINRYSVLFRMLRDARHRRRTNRSNYKQMEENAEHLTIVQALAAGDADAAAQAMAQHIQQAAEVLQQDLFDQHQIDADKAQPFLALQPTNFVPK